MRPGITELQMRPGSTELQMHPGITELQMRENGILGSCIKHIYLLCAHTGCTWPHDTLLCVSIVGLCNMYYYSYYYCRIVTFIQLLLKSSLRWSTNLMHMHEVKHCTSCLPQLSIVGYSYCREEAITTVTTTDATI